LLRNLCQRTRRARLTSTTGGPRFRVSAGPGSGNKPIHLKKSSYRVERPVTEHLIVQGRPDSRGGLIVFWCPNKTWTSPFDTSNTLTIVKSGLEMRKLKLPKVKGFKNSNKQTTKHYKSRFPNTQNNSFFVCCSIIIRIQTWFVELQVMFFL
jgi:hypothetical protein